MGSCVSRDQLVQHRAFRRPRKFRAAIHARAIATFRSVVSDAARPWTEVRAEILKQR